MAPRETRYVESKDGTRIGYTQIGSGPGVVLVQGAMGTARNFVELAEELSDAFTVVLPDRRGRGLSPRPYDASYTLQNDVDDLDALLSKTGARDVFGLSSGAIIALEAARVLPNVKRVAAFEPAFVEKIPRELVTRLHAEVAAGDVTGALVTGMQASGLMPAPFKLVPRFVFEWMTSAMLAREAKEDTHGYARWTELAPALAYDFEIVAEGSANVARLSAVTTKVLLLGGTKSPAYLKRALDNVENVLPNHERVTLRGLGHEAPWNHDARPRGGDPRVVARELRRFFS
jgi:pimeloyl-ACP methyl ester carboxylesterase